MKSVGKNFDFTYLKQLRKKRGYNFDILSRKSGISKPTLHAIESGKNIPTLSTIDSIANALDVSALDLIHLAHVPEVGVSDVRILKGFEDTGSNAVCACNKDLHCLCVKAVPGEVIDGKSVSCSLCLPYRVTCIVVEGKLRVSLGEREYIAEKGQFVCFPAVGRHCYSAVDVESRFVLVHSAQNIIADLESVLKSLTA